MKIISTIRIMKIKHYPDYENYKHFPDYENYKHSYNLVPSSSLQSCKMSPRYPDYVNYKPSSDLFHSSSLQFWNMLHRSISGLQNLLWSCYDLVNSSSLP